MNALVDALSGPVCQRLTWALVHFVWQGCAIAACVALCLRLLRIRSAQARYALFVGGIVLMAMAPFATYFALDERIDASPREARTLQPSTGTEPRTVSRPAEPVAVAASSTNSSPADVEPVASAPTRPR